jgi:hypothetical protein
MRDSRNTPLDLGTIVKLSGRTAKVVSRTWCAPARAWDYALLGAPTDFDRARVLRGIRAFELTA